MKLLARLAREDVARERAAEQLRQLRNMAAFANLLRGGEAGRRSFLDFDEKLVMQCND